MNRPIDAIHLAPKSRRRVVISQMGARQGMKMMSMFRKERAGACGRRGSKAHLAANLRLPVSASSLMPEWIGKVLDGLTGYALQKLAVLRHLPRDCRRWRLCKIPVGRGMPPDCHQRMT